jgi:hypothetical protein
MVKVNANGQLEMVSHQLSQLSQLEADHQSLVLHVVPQSGMKEAYNIQHLRGGLLPDERYIESLPATSHYDQVIFWCCLFESVFYSRLFLEGYFYFTPATFFALF